MTTDTAAKRGQRSRIMLTGYLLRKEESSHPAAWRPPHRTTAQAGRCHGTTRRHDATARDLRPGQLARYVRLPMPDPHPLEVVRYRVILADCDPMRIMYYGSYFRLFEIGWTELFRRLGLPVAEHLAHGRTLAVIDAACRYIRPARYDDLLLIEASLSNVGATDFEVHHKIARDDGEILARGRTLHAVLDDGGRRERVPEPIRQAGRATQGGNPAA
jgi:acyl-CoA thioester hydrolase